MDTTTPARPAAQVASSHRRRRWHIQPTLPANSPERIARRLRHIRILRTVGIVARTKCNCAQAARVTGILGDRQAMQDVYDLLDLRKIPRVRKGVRRVRVPETPSQIFATFVPRQECRRRATGLAAMVQELRAVANPLGEDVPRAPKARVICTCTVCGVSFESKQRRARYCGGACRIAHWRAEQ